MEGISLISTLAIGFGVALVLGFLAEKLKVPALVGYLLAGILVSPSVFGFDVDLNLANQLAEIGIMLLMFGVGLHFSLTDRYFWVHHRPMLSFLQQTEKNDD